MSGLGKPNRKKEQWMKGFAFAQEAHLFLNRGGICSPKNQGE
jgi:hypothetical protein